MGDEKQNRRCVWNASQTLLLVPQRLLDMKCTSEEEEREEGEHADADGGDGAGVASAYFFFLLVTLLGEEADKQNKREKAEMT